ncbi:MAG: Glu/Leu/Phe/Val family dehydrogenase [Candidatus Acidiferrales bacterium]
MKLLETMAQREHEQVIAFSDVGTGLRGFLAIHDTSLGPAFGGIRVQSYPSESEALEDVLRLSRGMTYKAALAELPCGGGKTVVMLHDGIKRREAFESLGLLVESLGGRYFTARDVGITDEDLEALGRTTRHVARDPSPGLGDISEHTAIGVWHGLRACLEFTKIGRARVAIQGVGSVGLWLAKILKREGMELLVADVDGARAGRAAADLGAKIVPADEILYADCDVLAPCALGGVISRETISKLKARVICGSANNTLAAAEDGEELQRRGILYAPDYLVNAGGLIRGAEFYFQRQQDSMPSLARIYERMRRILEVSRERGISTSRAADEAAEVRWKRSPRGSKTFRDSHWKADLNPALG